MYESLNPILLFFHSVMNTQESPYQATMNSTKRNMEAQINLQVFYSSSAIYRHKWIAGIYGIALAGLGTSIFQLAILTYSVHVHNKSLHRLQCIQTYLYIFDK